MNPKIEKVNGEIDKTKAKIADMQAHLRELERKKTGLENEEIVSFFRRENLTEDDLAAFVRQKSGGSSVLKPPAENDGINQMKARE